MNYFERMALIKMANKTNLLFIILISCGIFLRLHSLNKNDLWFDEAATASLSRTAPFTADHAVFYMPMKIWWDIPSYYLLLRFWTTLFGIFEYQLRLPSALFSIGTLFVMYFFTKEMFDKRTALIALLILSLSPFHIWYAQEARSYSMALFFGIVSTYSLYLFLHKKKPPLFYILFSTLNLYTNEFAVLLFIAQVFYALMSTKRMKDILVICLPFLLFLPWVSLTLQRVTFLSKGFWPEVPRIETLGITLHNLMLGYTGTRSLYMIGDVLIGFLLFRGLFAFKQTFQKNEVAFCCVLLILPILINWVFSRLFFSVYLDRGFLIVSPYLYILIAWAIERFRPNLLKGAMVSSFVILFIVGDVHYFRNDMYEPLQTKYHRGAYIKKPIKPLARYLKDNWRENDYLAIGNPCPAHSIVYYLKFYYNIPRERLKSSVRQVTVPGVLNTDLSRSYYTLYNNTPYLISVDSFFKMFSQKEGKVFFVGCDWARSGKLDKNSIQVKAFLDRHFRAIKEQDFDGIRLIGYEHKIN